MADDPLSQVAPDLRDIIELLPDLSDIGNRLEDVREALGGEAPALGDDGEVITSEVMIERADGSASRALMCRPSQTRSAPLPALVHVHGGGYVAGSANRDHDQARETALALQCLVLVPDYRLAPEHPFPAPLDDVLDSWRWLVAQAGALGVDPERIALRGISAGGGLACAAALKLCEESIASPCLLVLVFPMLDDRTAPHAHNGRYVWTHANNTFGWDSYLAGTNRSDPPALAVPGRVDDIAGLPPVFLETGSLDLFAAENLALARKLIDAGIALELHSRPGAFHGYTLVPCEAARGYHAASASALRRAFGQTTDGETP